MFPREIEVGLQAEYGIDVGDWHEGRLSSRRLLTLLDGLPPESWYKQSVQRLIDWVREEEERLHASAVSSTIFAQLTGQIIEDNS